jgi:hypothetical protein
LLAADQGMQPLVAKAREIDALSRLCDEFLPSELARQARAANLKDGRLVLLAANSAAAAKLKLLSESLTDFLLKQGAKVNSVSVRVQPKSVTKINAAAARRGPLSPAGFSALSELYRSLGDSPARRALKAFLDREAARRRPR